MAAKSNEESCAEEDKIYTNLEEAMSAEAMCDDEQYNNLKDFRQ